MNPDQTASQGESDLDPNCLLGYPNTSYDKQADDKCRTLREKG